MKLYQIGFCGACGQRTPFVASDLTPSATWTCMECKYRNIGEAAIQLVGELAARNMGELPSVDRLRVAVGVSS